MENIHERLLEAYFANTLTETDKNEMNKLLATDAAFAAEFAWRKSLERAIRTGAANDPFTLQLRDLERRFRFRKITIQLLAFAAAVALLITASHFFTQQQPTPLPENTSGNSNSQPSASNQPALNQPLSPEQLRNDSIQAAQLMQQQREEQAKRRALQDSIQKKVVANFRHFNNLSGFNTAGGVDEELEMAMNAFSLYNEAADSISRYRSAARAFDPVVKADPGNLEYQFYYGVALLGAQQYKAAVSPLQSVAAPPNFYQTPAKFYLGLALAGAGQYQPARKALKDYLEAPSGNGPFKKEAKNMLDQLPPR